MCARPHQRSFQAEDVDVAGCSRLSNAYRGRLLLCFFFPLWSAFRDDVLNSLSPLMPPQNQKSRHTNPFLSCPWYVYVVYIHA